MEQRNAHHTAKDDWSIAEEGRSLDRRDLADAAEWREGHQGLAQQPANNN